MAESGKIRKIGTWVSGRKKRNVKERERRGVRSLRKDLNAELVKPNTSHVNIFKRQD